MTRINNTKLFRQKLFRQAALLQEEANVGGVVAHNEIN
jgi:hypothetical protein